MTLVYAAGQGDGKNRGANHLAYRELLDNFTMTVESGPIGGFVNITQTAKRLVFCGTFTAGGLEISMENGKLNIIKEGKIRKFVNNVEQVSYYAPRALEIGREVLYVTERAVFRLTARGLELIETAPGVDPDTGVLALMDFKPVIRDVKTMPERLFVDMNGIARPPWIEFDYKSTQADYLMSR